MPIIKSAKKRVRIAKKATARNARTKRSLRGAIKTFQSVLTGKKKSGENQAKLSSALDKAVKKGVVSKKKAARRKSRLAAAAKKAGIKHTVGTKKAAKKPVAKKAPAKKPAAKKK